jgi:hypothetical protein
MRSKYLAHLILLDKYVRLRFFNAYKMEDNHKFIMILNATKYCYLIIQEIDNKKIL